MTVGFEVEGGLPLVLSRGLATAGFLGAAGALAFGRLVPDAREARAVARACFGLAVVAGLGWLAATAADLARGGWVAALPDVVVHTRFGRLTLVRLAVLAVAVALPPRSWTALGLALVVAGAQAWLGHGAAMADEEGPWLLISELAHVLAAGLWLGGLAPLALLLARAAPFEAVRAARRFSRLGMACVAVLAVTAVVQGVVLAGGVAGVIGTGYGWAEGGKTVLFAVLLGFAWRHRTRSTPALEREVGARGRMARSVAVETAFGVATVVVAALLSSLPPGMHEEPDWPFAVQPSLSAVREDPDIAAEVQEAGLAIALAASMFAACLIARRGRVPSAAVVVATGVLAGPHLSPLLIPAYPTSFYVSPTGFAADSIARGAALYPGHCAACHGPSGHGDGPAAEGLPVPPANLTAEHLWEHPDGELFWWLSHGIERPDGDGLAMPGFADQLDADDRWALIDFVRANNAGQARLANGGTWTRPVAAPDVLATCPDGDARSLSGLRGHVAVVTSAGSPPVPPAVPVIDLAPAPNACVAADTADLAGYRVVSGGAADAAATFVVDANGWLREVLPASATAADLDTAIATAAAHPLEAPSGGHRHHH